MRTSSGLRNSHRASLYSFRTASTCAFHASCSVDSGFAAAAESAEQSRRFIQQLKFRVVRLVTIRQGSLFPAVHCASVISKNLLYFSIKIKSLIYKKINLDFWIE